MRATWLRALRSSTTSAIPTSEELIDGHSPAPDIEVVTVGPGIWVSAPPEPAQRRQNRAVRGLHGR